MRRIRGIYEGLTLAAKIRLSYLLLLIPIILFQMITYYNLNLGTDRYDEMVDAAVTASEFSLDFKEDYDYETYLLIVGNKTIEESGLTQLLEKANSVVKELENAASSDANLERLKDAKKYLTNLSTYQKRIEDNLLTDQNYEDNIEIWENDVQIVTSLIRETMLQYIYYEIRGIEQSRLKFQNMYMRMLELSMFAFVGIVLLILLLSYYIPASITKPILRISKVTEQVANGDLSVRASEKNGAEVSMLNDSLNAMIDKINTLLEQVTKEQIRLREAELELLQSQINPHFLYNTLDTIVWLAESGQQSKVVSMVESLSDFFRTSLSHGLETVSIERELKHVRSYLEIQQVRYQDIMKYVIKVPKELYGYEIPKITLQPLVENALYHGIKNKRGLGTIIVSGKKEADCFLLEVKDNGIGMDEKRLAQVLDGIRHHAPNEKNIYGLYNVNERIQLKCGVEYGITIESIYGEGTRVEVKLPCVEVADRQS